MKKTSLNIINLLRYTINSRSCDKHSTIIADKWLDIKGDKTLRLQYPLNEESIVFDLGGYQGQWASDIFNKYMCNIFIFEPVRIFAKNIEDRFSNNRKVHIYPFGLADDTKVCQMYVDNDSSSIFKCYNSSNIERIKLICITEFIKEKKINCIDLMKINIEGGEYDLLEYLISREYIRNIENIQVQFHEFVPNAEGRMEQIQNKLESTHKLTYQYRFIWENWAIK